MSSLLEKIKAKKAAAGTAPAPITQPVTAEVQNEIVTESKPLSFAEKMALKKTQAAPAPAVPSTPAPVSISPIFEDPAPAAEPSEGIDLTGVDSDTATAYTDIAQRITKLEELSEDDLSNAMKELKKVLMENPNAVSLMLDADVGKMVIALRRITKVALVEATTPKKKGAKPKQMQLSAAEIEAAFDEL